MREKKQKASNMAEIKDRINAKTGNMAEKAYKGMNSSLTPHSDRYREGHHPSHVVQKISDASSSCSVLPASSSKSSSG